MNFHFNLATLVAVLTILGGGVALAIPFVQVSDFSVPAFLTLAVGVIQLIINVLNQKAVAGLKKQYGLK